MVLVIAALPTPSPSPALTVCAAFAGTKSAFALAASRAGESSGWQVSGTWTIPNAATGDVPNGVSQTFSVAVSDPCGATDIAAIYLLINTQLTGTRIQTPLLIMHGEHDPQAPPQESQEFVAALKQEGKTYAYFTYPGEGHGLTQRERRLDARRREPAILEEYSVR